MYFLQNIRDYLLYSSTNKTKLTHMYIIIVQKIKPIISHSSVDTVEDVFLLKMFT